ncbi:MAG: ABC transporter permease, partial [Vicinamibacterales bacterium]|nr:ABC transporter permease [Vicinamibacterales bacterium]
MVATVDFQSARLATAGDRAMAARSLLDAARTIPGIRAASWSYGTPPGGGLTDVGLWTSDASEGVSVRMRVDRHIIESDFFAVYGVPILKGRAFQSSDDEAATLVSERFARALWPGELDVIGRSFRFDGRRFHVIGLVGEVRFPSLDRTLDAPQWYMRLPEIGSVGMLTVRCNGACPDTSAVRRPLSAADSRLRVRDVRVLERVYSRELARPRAMATLALLLAVTALTAVAVGLFSMQTQSLAERRKEFAIRTALGASPNAIRRLVWRDALAIAIPGVGVGALGSTWVSQLLSALLFDVGGDRLSWVLVAGTIGVVVALSTWHPSRVAGHTAPTSLMSGW